MTHCLVARCDIDALVKEVLFVIQIDIVYSVSCMLLVLVFGGEPCNPPALKRFKKGKKRKKKNSLLDFIRYKLDDMLNRERVCIIAPGKIWLLMGN